MWTALLNKVLTLVCPGDGVHQGFRGDLRTKCLKPLQGVRRHLAVNEFQLKWMGMNAPWEKSYSRDCTE